MRSLWRVGGFAAALLATAAGAAERQQLVEVFEVENRAPNVAALSRCTFRCARGAGVCS